MLACFALAGGAAAAGGASAAGGLAVPTLLEIAGAAALLAASARVLLAPGRFTLRVRAALGAGLFVLSVAAVATLAPGAPRWSASLVRLGLALALAGMTLFLLREDLQRTDETTAMRAILDRRDADVRAQADRLRRLDIVDPATELMNRRAFVRAAQQTIEECAQAGQPLALLLIELATGTAPARPAETATALRRVADAVRGAVRGSDLAARWDRAQLALLLPRCRDPRPASGRLRSLLRENNAGEPSEIRLAGVTVNVGGPWPDPEGLMAAAQATLAAARRAPPPVEDTIWPIDWGLAKPAAADQS